MFESRSALQMQARILDKHVGAHFEATCLHVCLVRTQWPVCSVSATAWRSNFTS